MRSPLATCLLVLLFLGGGVFTTLSWRAAADVSRATRPEWVRQGAGSDALLRAATRDEDLGGVTRFEWQSLSPPDAYTIVASWEPTRPDDAELSQMFGGRAKPFANGSLQIRALQQSDSGAFNVAVKRGMKVTNTNINLTVYGPLAASVNVSKPGPLKANSDNVSLACEANSTDGVTFAWQRNGVELTRRDPLGYSLSEDGRLLTVAPVLPGDDHSLTCSASNPFFSARSPAAEIHVHGPLEVAVNVSWPGPLKADSDNVTLACVANATRGVAVAWLRSGKVLNSSESWRASLSRDQARLILAPVTAGDNGTITCHATNAFYSASSQAALLDVHEAVSKPTLTLTPATAVEGKDTVGGRCSCKSAGSSSGGNSSVGCGGVAGSALRVSWLRGSREFRPGEGRGSEMKMGPVRREDRGSYGCRVSNAVSVESSDPQTLAVIWLDLLPGKPVATTALNHEGNLSCTANAAPTPKFSWFRNGTPVGPAKEASDGTLCTSTLLVAGGTDSLLGEYMCVAANEVGSRNRTIVVTDAKLSSFTVFLDAHKRWALLRWTLKRWGGDNNGSDWGALTAVVVQRNASSAAWPAPPGRAAPAVWTLVARVPPAAQGMHNDSQLAGATAPAYRLLLEFGDVTQEEESAIAGLRVTCLDPQGADCAADSTPARDKVAETGIVVGSVLAISLVLIGLLAVVCFRKRKPPGQFDAEAAARRPQVYAGDMVPRQTSPTTTEHDIRSAVPPNTAPRDSDGGGDEVVVANVIDRRDGLAELREEEEVVVRENSHYVSYDTSRSSVPQQQQQQEQQQQQQQEQQQPPSQLQEPGHHDELEVTENHHDLSHTVGTNNSLPQQQQQPPTTTASNNNNSLPQQQQQPPSELHEPGHHDEQVVMENHHDLSHTVGNNVPQQPPSSGDSQNCGEILPVSSTQCNLIMAKHAANAEM